METILAPIDFSKSSDNALTYAANLCRCLSAKLLIFHTYHVPVINYEYSYLEPEYDMQSESENAVKEKLVELKKKFPELQIEFKVKMGFAADLIQEIAKEEHVDLIVMGVTEKNGVLSEHIIGSVSTQVAKKSTIPVLIVPEKAKFTPIKNMAYACDLDKSLEKNNTLLKVKYFCALFDAELEILNVIKPEEEITVEQLITDDYVEKELKTTMHKTFFIHDESVDHGLLNYVKHQGTDILITCPKNHNFLYNLFIETNTEKLAFHTPIPILTIHE